MSFLWPRVSLFIGSVASYNIASNSGLLSPHRQHSVSYCLLMWLELNDSHVWPQKHPQNRFEHSECCTGHNHWMFTVMIVFKYQLVFPFCVDFFLSLWHAKTCWLSSFFSKMPEARNWKLYFLKFSSAFADVSEKVTSLQLQSLLLMKGFAMSDFVCQSLAGLFSLWNAIAPWDTLLSHCHLGTSLEQRAVSAEQTACRPRCLTTILPTALSAGCHDSMGKTPETKHRSSSKTYEGTANEGGRNLCVSLQRL